MSRTKELAKGYNAPEVDAEVQTAKDYRDELSGDIIASGTATFTNSTNNIALTGVGIGVEVGDVIAPFGSVNNDKEFTIESIVNDDNIIVNAAHAGGTSSKSLVDETIAVTVTLLCKWYLAPIGLGQGWVDVTGSRVGATTYTNSTGRSITLMITLDAVNDNVYTSTIDGVNFSLRQNESALQRIPVSVVVPNGSTYNIVSRTTTFLAFNELR